MSSRSSVKAFLLLAVVVVVASRGRLAAGAGTEQATGERVASALERTPAAVIAEIQNLGGSVTCDEQSPNKPVVSVVLRGPAVTDAALEHFQGMPQLQRLILSVTRVSDAGLEHLGVMSQLQSLDLAYTQVTDAGLKQLKGLTQLQSLSLRGTRVTEAGVKQLQQALPNCNIRWSQARLRGAVALAPGRIVAGPPGVFGVPGTLPFPTTSQQVVAEIQKLGGKFVAVGQRSSWSPDGKKIVFGRSGNDNGILIYDVATNKTTPFTTVGKDPAWAGKEGRWIAYAAGSGTAEAIWAAEVPAGRPFRLRVGSLPSWAADGKTLFFQAFDQNQFMATEVTGSGQFSPPQSRSAVTYQYPAVSPDGKRVAYKSGGNLVIRQIDGGKAVKQFPLPLGIGMLGGWSPDGREFGFGGWNADDLLPCILLDVETGLARRVAPRWLTLPAWSPDGTKITFDLRLRTATEIWMLDAAAIKKLATFKMDPAAALTPVPAPGFAQRVARSAANGRVAPTTRPMTKEAIAERIKRTDAFLKLVDKNHDGKIDADEAKDPASKPLLDRIFSRLGKEPHYPVAIADLTRDMEAYYNKKAANVATEQPKPDQQPKGQTP